MAPTPLDKTIGKFRLTVPLRPGMLMSIMMTLGESSRARVTGTYVFLPVPNPRSDSLNVNQQ
jgi:hypothetical protein